MFGHSAGIRRVVVSAVGVAVMAVVAVGVPASASAREAVGAKATVVQHVTATPGKPTRHTDFWDW